jgi:hypothetical protein
MCTSPNFSIMTKSRTRWARQVAGMRENIRAYKILVGRRERQRPLRRHRLKWDYNIKIKVKDKAMPVIWRGFPRGCDTSRLPFFLHNRLTDGGEVVSLTRRPFFTPRTIPWYSFLLGAETVSRP